MRSDYSSRPNSNFWSLTSFFAAFTTASPLVKVDWVETERYAIFSDRSSRKTNIENRHEDGMNVSFLDGSGSYFQMDNQVEELYDAQAPTFTATNNFYQDILWEAFAGEPIPDPLP